MPSLGADERSWILERVSLWLLLLSRELGAAEMVSPFAHWKLQTKATRNVCLRAGSASKFTQMRSLGQSHILGAARCAFFQEEVLDVAPGPCSRDAIRPGGRHCCSSSGLAPWGCLTFS